MENQIPLTLMFPDGEKISFEADPLDTFRNIVHALKTTFRNNIKFYCFLNEQELPLDLSLTSLGILPFSKIFVLPLIYPTPKMTKKIKSSILKKRQAEIQAFSYHFALKTNDLIMNNIEGQTSAFSIYSSMLASQESETTIPNNVSEPSIDSTSSGISTTALPFLINQ